MTSVFSSVTIGSTPVQITANHLLVCKLFLQSAPGNSGLVKIGGSSSLTMDNSTAGIYLVPGAGGNPGEDWSIESSDSRNTISVEQYWIHGGNAGDVVMVQVNQG